MAAGAGRSTWRRASSAGCAPRCVPRVRSRMSGEYELAVRSRRDLLTIVRRGELTPRTPEKPLTPQPLRGANIGCADVPLPAAGEGEQVDALGRELAEPFRSRLRRSLHVRHMDAGSDNS